MIRNILAVVSGVLVGSFVNMFIIKVGPNIIALPEGVDFSDGEKLKSGIKLLETKHYIIPFMAHALGSFSGSIVAGLMAKRNQFRVAISVSFAYLLGGIAMVFSLDTPLWYDIVDLLFAYLPLGYLAGRIVTRKS
jgi:hypothetical protein